MDGLHTLDGVPDLFCFGGFALSLVALQMLCFYLSQYSALTTTLLQLALLQFLLAYRHGYFPRA